MWKVTIVGAGALGWVIGARLATLADCKVTLVARAAAPARPVRLERIDAAEAFEWTSPVVAGPPDADVILSCVRYEHLDAMAEGVAGLAAPVVALTPMMPRDFARIDARIGGRLVAAMPSVVAYEPQPDVVRYWIPRPATTLIDARVPGSSEVELARRLERAGITAKVEPNVLLRNVATTVSFLPLAMALDVARGVDALLANKPLLRLGLDAAEEGRALARAIAPLPGWASVVTPFLGPFTLKMGIGVIRARAPEVIRYADAHFGGKLRIQNVAMGEAIVDLAHEKRTKSTALEALVARLRPDSNGDS